MKLRTKVPVNYNSGITGNQSGIVIGTLQDCAWLNDFTMLGANYTYSNEAGELIFKNSFTVSGDDIQALYDAIKADVPAGLSYAKTNEYQFNLGFIYEMAHTFSIPLTDIEIVS